MKISFLIMCKDNPVVDFSGFVNMDEDSDYCLNFYDQYDDICFRIPVNPFEYYTDEYYDYLDVVYSFETDEEFMPILKEFAESNELVGQVERPGYFLALEKL